MFLMTKSRELDKMQTPFSFVATCHSGEDVKIDHYIYVKSNSNVVEHGRYE